MEIHRCRVCGKTIFDDGLKYGVRHYAHHACYLKAGKKLADLSPWKVARFPYFVLKAYGLLDEAQRLAANEIEWIKENKRLK